MDEAQRVAEVENWWTSLGAIDGRLDLSDPQLAATVLRSAVAAGLLELPRSGAGIAARWTVFETLGRLDVTLIRLAEGHADALSILSELAADVVVQPEQVWGVWAAAPDSLRADVSDGHWTVSGDRPWCSGAGACTHALVTARAADGTGLFALPTAQEDAIRPMPDSWPAVGMSGSDSRTVCFRRASAVRIGGPDAYISRPGFWHGGAGVAACWYGGALGIAEDLRTGVHDDPHQLAHLGAVETALAAGRAVLDAHARAIDLDPDDLSATARRRTLQTRAVIEDVAERVLRHTGRALGASPLCRDRRHARRVADLTVYLRQSHAESDLQILGKLAVERCGWPWP